MTIQVGTLQSVPIREVWRDEARDLTPWLAENPSLLDEALGLELELEGQEVAVGPFSADLLFRDVSSGQLVVVENLINPTDHDHLGKVITYAAGLGAHHVVLLAERFRPEHRSALTWLNSISDDDHCFFGLSLEVWKIGDSTPAPRLRLEVQPDDWARTVRSTASHALTDHQQACLDFWDEFLPIFHEAHPGWSKATKPQKQTWMNFPSGRSGIAFTGAFARRDGNPVLRAELYIDFGDQEENKALFDDLHARRQDIESVVGEALEWNRLDDRRSSRISLYYPAEAAVKNRNLWPELHPWLAEGLGIMRQALGPHL